MRNIFSKSNQFSGRRAKALFLLPLFFFFLTSIVPLEDKKTDTTVSKSWAKKTLEEMTLKEKIGQLFMVAAYSNRGTAHENEIKSLIKDHHIGGLIFFQGGPVRQARLTNKYQELSKLPLFMAMDAEWGLAMRLDSTVSYPRQVLLGAIKDKKLIYKMGEHIALQSRRLGMQINFAPVVDVNVNPLNPVIGTRSFGENKEEVALRSYEYMKGMQDHYVLANAKHFPGHGDTDVDSHLGLPVINHKKSRLNDIELYPFKELFKSDLKSVMVAHIHIPALDSTPNRATTLSPKVVTDLLRKELGFNGLAFTDALNMKGVAKYYEPGETDLLALKAGNDVLLYPLDVPKAVNKIREAVKNGQVLESDLDAHVLKILEAKEWSKIKETTKVEEQKLYEDLNKEEYEALNYKLREKALTLLKKNEVLPIHLLQGKKVLSISVGSKASVFNSYLSEYTLTDELNLGNSDLISSKIENIKKRAHNYDVVVLSIKNLNNRTRARFGVTAGLEKLISEVGSMPNVITCHYGNAYSLKHFSLCSNLICAYEKHSYAEQAMTQAIVGAIALDGTLPVSSGDFKQGDGIVQKKSKVLGFDFAFNAGVDLATLEKIDSIMLEAINIKATPGGQVLVAKKGKVIYDKSFGRMTYSPQSKPITHHSIYDLASVTKVLASGLTLMSLRDEGKFDLNKQLKYYLPELDSTNKGDLVVKNVLAHQAGLKPYIPYWAKTVERKRINKDFYSTKKSKKYPLKVASNLYAKESLRDSVYKWSDESELLDTLESGEYPYKYSDIGYYYMLRIIEKVTGSTLEDYLLQHFYQKMNLPYMRFRPLAYFTRNEIAPTEDDNYFRKQQIHGDVHDQGASMMGGVAGHAGLFSNSFDVAQLLQMLLNGGDYGGERYLSTQTIKEFTAKQLTGENRKGATWDRMRPEGDGSSSDYASENSFGHSGFTGTLVWVDPDYDLIYVFLSNRVYPDASNKKLVRENIRTKVQDIIYESILNYNVSYGIYEVE